jgi:hypothetical protein
MIDDKKNKLLKAGLPSRTRISMTMSTGLDVRSTRSATVAIRR